MFDKCTHHAQHMRAVQCALPGASGARVGRLPAGGEPLISGPAARHGSQLPAETRSRHAATRSSPGWSVTAASGSTAAFPLSDVIHVKGLTVSA